MTEAYIPHWNMRTEEPEHIAYFDGEKYQCYECESTDLIECGGISYLGVWDCPTDEIPQYTREAIAYYTPVLRCRNCGRTYFGVQTTPPTGEAVIRKTAEERITELEERIARLEETLASVINSRERPAIKKPERHEEHREQSPKHEEEYIILPSIMTA